jgi:hypothetical protein
MPLAQLIEPPERIVETPAPSRCGESQQRVGHAAHRGYDHGGPASVARARRVNNLNQSLNCFGIGDRGAAEFLDNHKQQILLRKGWGWPSTRYA